MRDQTTTPPPPTPHILNSYVFPLLWSAPYPRAVPRSVRAVPATEIRNCSVPAAVSPTVPTDRKTTHAQDQDQGCSAAVPWQAAGRCATWMQEMLLFPVIKTGSPLLSAKQAGSTNSPWSSLRVGLHVLSLFPVWEVSPTEQHWDSPCWIRMGL